MSTLTSTYSVISNKEHGDTPDSYNQGISAFEALDSQQGIVRHATFVQSQYRCFFVTGDNVATMLRSTQDQVRKALVKQIMTQLRDEALLMSGDCLRMMEKEWTGHARISRHHLDQVHFYTSVTYASFILPDWTQVRELSVIAVVEDACKDLATASMYNPQWLSFRWPPYRRECEMDALKTIIMRLHAGDTKHILLAAIQRLCISVKRNESRIVLLKSNAISKDIVHYIYNNLKREQIEPEESFLQTFVSFDQIHLLQTSLQPLEFGNINSSSDCCVLVYAGSHKYDAEHHMSSVCVFFTNGPPNVPTLETLGLAIRNTFENYDVYHSSRVNRVLNFRALGKDKSGTSWNIENSHGFFLAGFDFVDWISSLGCEPPSRQGSTRPGTSADLFSRNFYPWRDPDYIDSSSDLATRVSYLQDRQGRDSGLAGYCKRIQRARHRLLRYLHL
ncbi:hypothetical protein N7488_004689 [Penicillium malachiteum]|nr:hypothetical protein N7488_004689 [Penicillium malachiteum]